MKGFTLVELLAILLIVGILAVSAYARFSSPTEFQVQASRDDLVAALFYAQQLAMARNSTIAVVTTANSVSVTEDGGDLMHGSAQYPLTLNNSVVLSPATTLTYNRLGETTATTFSLSKAGVSLQVTVSAAGYAQ